MQITRIHDMTGDQATYLEDQIEMLDWYRRVVNVALQLQMDDVYTRANAVTDLTELAREMAIAFGLRWRIG